jgi:chromosome segregation ATPase
LEKERKTIEELLAKIAELTAQLQREQEQSQGLSSRLEQSNKLNGDKEQEVVQIQQAKQQVEDQLDTEKQEHQITKQIVEKQKLEIAELNARLRGMEGELQRQQSDLENLSKRELELKFEVIISK